MPAESLSSRLMDFSSRRMAPFSRCNIESSVLPLSSFCRSTSRAAQARSACPSKSSRSSSRIPRVTFDEFLTAEDRAFRLWLKLFIASFFCSIGGGRISSVASFFVDVAFPFLLVAEAAFVFLFVLTAGIACDVFGLRA